MNKYNRHIKIDDGIEYISIDDCSGFIVDRLAMNSAILSKLNSFADVHTPPIYNINSDKFYFLDYDRTDVKSSMVAIHLSKDQVSVLVGTELSDSEFMTWKEDKLIELKDHDPEFFTHITGRELSIFDSQSLMSDFVLRECCVSRLIITDVQQSDNAKNYVVVSGYTSNHPDEDHEVSFLTPCENYLTYKSFIDRNIPLTNW